MAGISLTRATWNETLDLGDFPDRTVQQSLAWVNFIAQSQNAEPVFAVVNKHGRPVGRFTGLVVNKSGVRILGSPLPGWTTSYMGFNLPPSVCRMEAVRSLERFCFNELDCLHFEVMDRHLSCREAHSLGCKHEVATSFEVDLSRDEGEIFSGMKPSCRRAIRKAEKAGLRIEIATDASFADDYYAQLEDVFEKQGLAPTYPRERVTALIEHLLPTGRLLLLRAINRDGLCVGTSIFPAMNDSMFFWGGASWRGHQIDRPNEAMMWFAMRYWKARGITRFDMGGGGDYKKKYGVVEIQTPWIRKSKYELLEHARNLSKVTFALKQRYFRRRGASPTLWEPGAPRNFNLLPPWRPTPDD